MSEDPKKPFEPKVPTFGGVQEVGTDSKAAWTGGKPKADYSGLEEPDPTVIAPAQFRVNSITSQAKSQHYRTKGLDEKFKRDGNLQTFEKKVWKHFTKNGLDTITYIPDPTDGTKVVSVIESHSLFDKKTGTNHAQSVMDTYYDAYDMANVEDAKDFLISSVDDDLEQQIVENCEPDDSFVTYWLQLIHIIKSSSVERYDKIKECIKTCNLSQ